MTIFLAIRHNVTLIRPGADGEKPGKNLLFFCQLSDPTNLRSLMNHVPVVLSLPYDRSVYTEVFIKYP